MFSTDSASPMTKEARHDLGPTWTWEFIEPGNQPDVSIVICAYMNGPMTLRCLGSLVAAQHMNTSRAEVIVIDDASPDDSFESLQSIRGIRLHRVPTNIGFLRAANEGLRLATGKDVMFLNNDTMVVGRWLDPLTDLFARRASATCVGAKLVYPDGVLQDAGGVIFSDATGWNYGRGLHPLDPLVTFERQVDFASGAALLVRGDFIRARGGFDVDLAPAYYEDVDLCFAARAAGGEVWYQPSSMVVHHEGASHGTDLNSGVKQYQEVNRHKFLAKWRREVECQMDPDAGAWMIAGQRMAKGRILYFDNEVPTFDQDAGSKRAVSIMSAMLKLGFAVTFIPMNDWRRQPYTAELEKLGVEVMGNSADHWELLAARAPSVSFVWMSRSHIVEEYLERVGTLFPSAIHVYDTIDLNFLRIGREAAIVDDESKRLEAQHLQANELRLMESVDVTVVVSPYERELISGLTRSKVEVVPIVHDRVRSAVAVSNRSGILFVGGFRHAPNADGICWFVKDVMPLVWSLRPDAIVQIVGASAPDPVLALVSEQVEVLGWVPDLEALYRQSRLAIAPLRFGAGVKGKVAEALGAGLPMVLTTVAAEGMHIQDGVHALVGDVSDIMAAQILRLLSDDELWQSLSSSGMNLMHEKFGPEATSIALTNVLEHEEPLKGHR